jgi:uncharacterized protein
VERPLVRLTLRVSPGGRQAAFVGRHGDAWKVRVKAPPERGRANAELIELLMDTLKVARPDVRIVAGGAGRDKIVELSGVTEADVEAVLASIGTERL